MEPGHEDREYRKIAETIGEWVKPQWSPVMKTGNTEWLLALASDTAFSLNGARS